MFDRCSEWTYLYLGEWYSDRRANPIPTEVCIWSQLVGNEITDEASGEWWRSILFLESVRCFIFPKSLFCALSEQTGHCECWLVDSKHLYATCKDSDLVASWCSLHLYLCAPSLSSVALENTLKIFFCDGMQIWAVYSSQQSMERVYRTAAWPMSVRISRFAHMIRRSWIRFGLQYFSTCWSDILVHIKKSEQRVGAHLHFHEFLWARVGWKLRRSLDLGQRSLHCIRSHYNPCKCAY